MSEIKLSIRLIKNMDEDGNGSTAGFHKWVLIKWSGYMNASQAIVVLNVNDYITITIMYDREVIES